MIRAAIYMRVSTDKQAKEGDSIPAQREALLKYIDSKPDMILAGTYLDDGISGTKSDRDELNRLLEDVKAGEIDVILVTKLDRLYRSIRHYLNMMDILDKHGVGWTAIWEPIYDTTTPAGRLIVNQMMSIAQFEAENTGQRIRQVFAYKKAKGEICSGNVTPGFRIENKHLVHSDLAPAVREVFEYYARTGKLYETVRHAAPGLPTSNAGMKHLLQHRMYIGEAYGNPNFCEPIVDKELFDRVQMQLSRNIKKSQKRTYLFSGIVRCAECGCVMASGSRKRKDSRTKYYRCPHYHQRAEKTCSNSRIVNEKKIEKFLLVNLHPLIDHARMEAEEAAAPAKDIKKQRKTIESKLERLTDLYVDGQISKDDYLSRKEAFLTELDALEMPARPSESHFLSFDVMEGMNLYQRLNEEEKRLFWRSLIKEIRYEKGSGDPTVFFL